MEQDNLTYPRSHPKAAHSANFVSNQRKRTTPSTHHSPSKRQCPSEDCRTASLRGTNSDVSSRSPTIPILRATNEHHESFEATSPPSEVPVLPVVKAIDGRLESRDLTTPPTGYSTLPIARATNEYHESFEAELSPTNISRTSISPQASAERRASFKAADPGKGRPNERQLQATRSDINRIHETISETGKDWVPQAIQIEAVEDSSLGSSAYAFREQRNPVMPHPTNITPVSSLPLYNANILRHYGPAKKRLLLFDYDGTLTEIVKVASRAVIPDVLHVWLKTLASEPRNIVWVISGRDQAFLQVQLGNIPRIGLVAEHGAFMRQPESDKWENLVAEADMSWRLHVRKAFEVFVHKNLGARIEEKKVALVLHYRVVDRPDLAAMRAADCKASLEKQLKKWPVEIINGKCVVEARPANVDKGQIVLRIINELKHSGVSPDFLLCVGDDVTDEDMFLALRPPDEPFELLKAAEASGLDLDFELPDCRGSRLLPKCSIYTVVVRESDRGSAAEWYLVDPTEVFATIKMLNDCDRTGDVKGLGLLEYEGKYRGSRVLPVPRSFLL